MHFSTPLLFLASCSSVVAAPHLLGARQEASDEFSQQQQEPDFSLVEPDSTIIVEVAGVNLDLVPQFGVVKGTNANAQQVGSCDGFNGQASVLIPCFCPPDRDVFLQRLGQAMADGNVLGEPIQFSNDATDQSEETNRLRATALVVVLQNFNGTKGVGCPAASAPNFLSQQRTGILSNKIFVGAD